MTCETSLRAKDTMSDLQAAPLPPSNRKIDICDLKIAWEPMEGACELSGNKYCRIYEIPHIPEMFWILAISVILHTTQIRRIPGILEMTGSASTLLEDVLIG